MEINKPTVVVILSHNFAVSSFVVSGALKVLDEQYNIIYVHSDTVSFEHPNCIKINYKERRSKFAKFIDYHLWYLAYFKYFKQSNSIHDWNKSFKFRMLTKNQGIFMKVLSLPLLYEFIMPIFEKLIVGYNEDMYRCMERLKPSLIILPGIVFDSFSLDALKCARKRSIKNIMLITHWDFFTGKGFLRGEPDFIGVWGQQMREMAVRSHKIIDNKVKIVGAPRFEIYKKEIELCDARKELGLPLNKIIFLFAGMSLAYDEMSILAEIDDLIGTELPSDILVLYRPHPRRHPRKNELVFERYQFKNIILDPQNATKENNLTEDSSEYFKNLLYSINAIITPFSTMTVEAALCGKPCLTIAFSDDVHEWQLEYALRYEHLQPLLGYQWVTLCKKRTDLSLSMHALLETLSKPDIAETIKNDINYIVYSDKDSYSQRLLTLVAETVG